MNRTGTGASWRPAVTAALLAAAAYRLRFGYAVGYSDQDDFLPWLLHRMDPSLLARDWFVGVQSGAFNVRSGFVAVLEALAALIGVEPAVNLWYAAAWALLGLSVFGYLRSMSRSSAASIVGTVLLLAVVPRWTLGGNALAASMLVPSLVAWSLGIAALALHVRGSTWPTGVAVGAAAWIQPLVALVVAIALVGAEITRPRTGERLGRRLAAFTVPVGLIALPALVLPLLSTTAPVDPGSSPPFVDLLTRFRAPHHYRPGSFPLSDWIQFGLLLGAGFAGRGMVDRAERRHAAGLLAVVGLFLCAGFLGTAIPALSLAQPFKATVLGSTVLATLSVVRVTAWIREAAPARLERVEQWTERTAPVLLAAMVLSASVLVRPASTAPDPDLAAAADWIGQTTERNAVIAVPPSTTGFRYRSRRAVVVTLKTAPFSAPDLAAWYRRLSDMAPDPDALDPGSAADHDALDAAYERLTPEQIGRVAERYDVSFVVRRTAVAPDAGRLVPVFRSGPVIVYEVVGDAS